MGGRRRKDGSNAKIQGFGFRFWAIFSSVFVAWPTGAERIGDMGWVVKYRRLEIKLSRGG